MIKESGNRVAILTKGKHISFDKQSKKVILKDIDINNIASWKDGILFFLFEGKKTQDGSHYIVIKNFGFNPNKMSKDRYQTNNNQCRNY